MRLFTAIDIPPEIGNKLRALVDRLRPLADLKWNLADDLHLTIKFIGEWPEDRLDELQRTLAGVDISQPVEIQVRGLGWFPNPRRPHVFWAGIEAGETLKTLARSTEQAVAKLGVPVEDRPYSPHLTLARIKDRTPLGALRDAIHGLESQAFGAFRASAFFLYLSSNGKYTRLAEFRLSKPLAQA